VAVAIGMAEATWHTRKNPDEAAEISTRWISGLWQRFTADPVFDAARDRVLALVREEVSGEARA
jgi:hypothetical protein